MIILTKKEMVVYDYAVLFNYSHKMIARKMNISVRTVKHHTKNILVKYECRDMKELMWKYYVFNTQ